MENQPKARADRLTSQTNNFDVLRLVAASMVLVSHSFTLVGSPQPTVPLTGVHVSTLGLLVFFAISGFLVTRSWVAEPRLLRYVAKRALRIVPALLVSLAVTAYALGALASTERSVDYLVSPEPAHYVRSNTGALVNYVVPDSVRVTRVGTLPGTFAENPSSAVNGSLWTLPIEVRAYALLALIGLLVIVLPARAGTRAGVLLIAAAAIAYLAARHNTLLLTTFAGGAALYLLRTRVPLRGWLMAAAVVAWVASSHLPFAAEVVVSAVALPYAVIFLGFRGLGRVRWLTRPGDVSYGIYIYAWPVQQFVIASTGTRSPWLVIAVAGAATYALAYLSWILVERPALRFKRYLHGASAPTREEGQILVPGGVRAPSVVRRQVEGLLGAKLSRDNLAALRLLTTELVSNSVRHGGVDERGWIRLSLMRSGTTLRVELRDSGIQGRPVERPPSAESGNGYGLRLLSGLASRWSFDHHPDLCVWFELDSSFEPDRRPVGARRGERRRAFAVLGAAA